MNEQDWAKLLRSLRRLVRFRELSAPPDVIDKEIALAHKVRRALRIDGWLDFPEDVRNVAIELGILDPNVDADIRRRLAAAHEAFAIARAIDARLAAADLPDLEVAVTDKGVLLAGTVVDESARARAREVVDTYLREAATGIALVDRLVVSPRV